MANSIDLRFSQIAVKACLEAGGKPCEHVLIDETKAYMAYVESDSWGEDSNILCLECFHDLKETKLKS